MRRIAALVGDVTPSRSSSLAGTFGFGLAAEAALVSVERSRRLGARPDRRPRSCSPPAFTHSWRRRSTGVLLTVAGDVRTRWRSSARASARCSTLVAEGLSNKAIAERFVRRRAHRRSPRHSDLPQAAPRRRPGVTPPSAWPCWRSCGRNRLLHPLFTIGYMSSRRYVEGDLPDDGTVLDAFVKLSSPSRTRRTVTGWMGWCVGRCGCVAGSTPSMPGSPWRRPGWLPTDGGEAAATVLAGGGRRARRDAEAAAERGGVCASMPACR